MCLGKSSSPSALNLSLDLLNLPLGGSVGRAAVTTPTFALDSIPTPPDECGRYTPNDPAPANEAEAFQRGAFRILT